MGLRSVRFRWGAAVAAVLVAGGAVGVRGAEASAGASSGASSGAGGAVAARAVDARAARAPGAGAGCDPLATVKPLSPMPAPGRMPGGSTMARIVQRGRLIAGVDQNTYLFGYRNPATGRLEGLDIDLLRAVSKALFGRTDRIQFIAIPSSRRISVLTGGQVDIVAHSLTITCERMRQVRFSRDYLDSGKRVLVPRDSAVRSLKDLAGRRVCSAANTTSIDALRAARPRVVPVAVADWTDCLVRMQLGTVDAVSTTDNVLAGLAAQDPATKLVGPRFTFEPHGVAVARGSGDFARFVNGVLEGMSRDGSLAALQKEWVGKYGDFAPSPPHYG